MGENEQVVKLSLEDFGRFKDDDSPDFATARILFLSTRPNSHEFILSEDVLREYSKTILGKFVIGNLNYMQTDVTTHLQEPDIYGYVPMEQEIEFVRADDGYLDAYVDAVISKIYATKIYDLFANGDNFRSVSIEAMFKYMSEDSKEVIAFNIAGVTILGKMVNPSVPHAHMEIIKFSADEAEKYYVEKCSQSKFETEVLGKLNLICDKLNQNETDNVEETEETMAKLEEEKNVVMDKPTEEEVEKKDEKLSEETPQEMTEDTSKLEEAQEEDKQEDEKLAEPKEEEKEQEKEDEDVDDGKEEEKEEEKEDKLSDELAEKEEKCKELEAKCAELETKLSELEKFKADTEEKEKMSIVTQTLAQVKNSMSEENYAKFEAKAKDCTLETVSAWKNEVLANVATVLMQHADESHLRMSIDTEDNQPKGLWDRL